ncbi:MAG: hypothetical protein JO100_09965 [Pseudonocardia sp.]|nr:hypothetical protein [Pseudonocardia sp.]
MSKAVRDAAATSLRDRVRFVEELAKAVAAQQAEEARERVRAAAEVTAAASRAALGGGWTSAELRQLGYGDARRTRPVRNRKAAAVVSDDGDTADGSPEDPRSGAG